MPCYLVARMSLSALASGAWVGNQRKKVQPKSKFRCCRHCIKRQGPQLCRVQLTCSQNTANPSNLPKGFGTDLENGAMKLACAIEQVTGYERLQGTFWRRLDAPNIKLCRYTGTLRRKLLRYTPRESSVGSWHPTPCAHWRQWSGKCPTRKSAWDTCIYNRLIINT